MQGWTERPTPYTTPHPTPHTHHRAPNTKHQAQGTAPCRIPYAQCTPRASFTKPHHTLDITLRPQPCPRSCVLVLQATRDSEGQTEAEALNMETWTQTPTHKDPEYATSFRFTACDSLCWCGLTCVLVNNSAAKTAEALRAHAWMHCPIHHTVRLLETSGTSPCCCAFRDAAFLGMLGIMPMTLCSGT